MPPKNNKKQKPEAQARRTQYKALVGISYNAGHGKKKRVKPGEVVDDLPERVVEVLLPQGAIEEV